MTPPVVLRKKSITHIVTLSHCTIGLSVDITTYINSELDDERSQFKSVSAPKTESLTIDLKAGRY